jgi:hypothetical protein
LARPRLAAASSSRSGKRRGQEFEKRGVSRAFLCELIYLRHKSDPKTEKLTEGRRPKTLQQESQTQAANTSDCSSSPDQGYRIAVRSTTLVKAKLELIRTT